MTLWAMARASYREFFAVDRARIALACAAAACSVGLHVALAVLLERVAGGHHAIGVAAALVAVAVAVFALEVAMDVWLIEYTVFRPQRRTQLGLLTNFLRRLPERLAATTSGDLSAASVQYIDGVWYVRDAIRAAHAAGVVVILAVIIAAGSPLLAAVAVAPTVLLGAVVALARRRWVELYTREREARATLDTFVTDAVRGVMTVKLLNAEARTDRRAAELAGELQRRWFWVDMAYLGAARVLSSVVLVLVPLFLLVGGHLIGSGQLTSAHLVSLYVIFNLLGTHSSAANSMAGYVLNDIGELRHVQEFLDAPTEGDAPADLADNSITLTDVTYRRPERADPVLASVSLDIAPGDKVALVGRSGAGKSTVLALLSAMLSPESGDVRVGGVTIGPDNARALRRSVTVVGQAPLLFDTDLELNLTLGRPTAPDAIDEALRVAGLRGFLDALPDGLQTRLGAGGTTVSGGERARLCLARAVLRDTPVLLLDEVTAQLDAVHEREVMANLLDRTPDTTTVAVSHRLSSVRDFPRIVLLDGGRIVADGTHDELIATSAAYADLWGLQAAPA